jgi:hypothetical protein
MVSLQVILSISHHTLDPMRRAVGLDKWPYLEVSRGQFCMTGEEICAYRDRMLCVADDTMKKILKRMARRADECRTSKRPLPPMKRSKTHASDKKVLDENAPPLVPPPLDLLLSTQNQLLAEDQPAMIDAEVQVAFGEDPEQAFWDEISQIIMLDATPPGGPEPSYPDPPF